MIVQFSGSEKNFKDSIGYYRSIIAAIKKAHCELSLDWVEKAYSHYKKAGKKSVDNRDWKLIHKQSIDALKRADFCIYEASEKSFSIGFQTALALQMKKPILVLSRNDSMRDSFGSGIVSDLLTYKTYTTETVERIVGDFISSNTLSVHDLRFNFVIDKEINNYLRWAAFNLNTTKAEIVRRILRKKIEESNGE